MWKSTLDEELPHKDLDEAFLGFAHGVISSKSCTYSVENLLCRRHTPSTMVFPIWRVPKPEREVREFWIHAVRKGSFEFVGELCTFKTAVRSGICHGYRMVEAIIGDHRLSALDANVYPLLLAQVLSPDVYQRNWSIPTVMYDSSCVRTGKCLGMHIPVTDAMSALVIDGVSRKRFVFDTKAQNLMIARKDKHEVLCLKGKEAKTKTDICILLGVKKFE